MPIARIAEGGGKAVLRKEPLLFALALAALASASAASLFVGVSGFGIGDIIAGDPRETTLFIESRGPRLAAILLSGSAIGVAGLIMQSLVRNWLVAPTTAGTADAAGLGLIIASIWFGGATIFLKMAIAVVFAIAGTAPFLAPVQRVRYSDILLVPLVGIILGASYRRLRPLWRRATTCSNPSARG